MSREGGKLIVTRFIAIAALLLLQVATARVPADLLALRSQAVNDPPAAIVAGRQLLDSHKLDGRPADEREVLYWLGNAALREANEPTLPSTIARELQINPFLRSGQIEVVHAAQQLDPTAADAVAVFTAIRQWKNNF